MLQAAEGLHHGGGELPGIGAAVRSGGRRAAPSVLCMSFGLWAPISSLVNVLFGLDNLKDRFQFSMCDCQGAEAMSGERLGDAGVRGEWEATQGTRGGERAERASRCPRAAAL